jgi:ABC-type nitrate/sulfonate/bicarbonate transport system ATPase subunit
MAETTDPKPTVPPAEPAPAAPKDAAAKPKQGLLEKGPIPKLSVRDLVVTYLSRDGDPVLAVDNISFSIADKPGIGEIVVFLGPSGCGKSTILKVVAGLLTPTKGEILSDGKPIAGTSRDRGMVFQAYTSFSWLSCQHNVEYGLKLAGVDGATRAKKARDALGQVGLADFAKRYPKELSGGMKQRLAIARTLVNEPRLLLMDEPFGALDPQTRWGMQSLMLDISRKLDNTILFVTHDVSEAVYLADTVYVLSARPAKILHRVDIPYFAERDAGLRASSKFREVENQILTLLQDQPKSIRVS